MLFASMLIFIPSENAAGVEWLSDWEYRINIIIDDDDISGDLSGFPLLLHINASCGKFDEDLTAIFDEIGVNGQRMAITESDGTTQLYAEIEEWNSTSEEGNLWVNVSSITNVGDTTLYIDYDKEVENKV